MSAINNLIIFCFIKLILILFCVDHSLGQYEDVRCKCVCPLPGVVTNGSDNTNRKLYIGTMVQPNRCNCDGVVLPQLGPTMQGKAKEFCPRCECKYESRNTSTIRWVVIFIIGIISFLVVYMGFLMLLDPLIHKCKLIVNSNCISNFDSSFVAGQRSSYEEHINEEVSLDEQIANDSDGTRRRATTPIQSPSSFGGPPPKNVLNRVGLQQNKWKKQVQEQRENIYDKHKMLN